LDKIFIQIANERNFFYEDEDGTSGLVVWFSGSFPAKREEKRKFRTHIDLKFLF